MYTTAATYGTEQDRMIFGEKSDHLGNVRAVVSDIRKPTNTTGSINTWTWQADITDHFSYYPFGMLEPGRQKRLNTLNAGGYRFGFNGKEMDNEWTGNTGVTYDYGFRIYDARIAKFLSVDPLTKDYPMLTPYQFASNTPIQAIDIDGLEAFFVGGTWQGGNEPGAWSSTSQSIIKDAFGNTTTKHASWSGNNNSIARKIDAYDVAETVFKTWSEGGKSEPITLVGHSHGGNVMIEAANILYRDYGVAVDNLLTVNTPVTKKHQLSADIKDKVNHINVYNESDKVQSKGGSWYTIKDSDDDQERTGSKIIDTYNTGEDELTGEMGPAKRKFKNAVNIKYDHQTGYKDKDYGKHMGNWLKNVLEWGPKVKEHQKTKDQQN